MAKQKTMAFQINPEYRKILEQQAEIEERSLSYMINLYMREAFEKRGLVKPKPKKPA
jgi:hypothetical protein